jgi:hypothetical protein
LAADLLIFVVRGTVVVFALLRYLKIFISVFPYHCSVDIGGQTEERLVTGVSFIRLPPLVPKPNLQTD